MESSVVRSDRSVDSLADLDSGRHFSALTALNPETSTPQPFKPPANAPSTGVFGIPLSPVN